MLKVGGQRVELQLALADVGDARLLQAATELADTQPCCAQVRLQAGDMGVERGVARAWSSGATSSVRAG